jgi:hypothetical protein
MSVKDLEERAVTYFQLISQKFFWVGGDWREAKNIFLRNTNCPIAMLGHGCV